MAYNANNLSAIAYANGFTVWHYKTDDTPEEVASADYFSAARAMVRRNDLLIVGFEGYYPLLLASFYQAGERVWLETPQFYGAIADVLPVGVGVQFDLFMPGRGNK